MKPADVSNLIFSAKTAFTAKQVVACIQQNGVALLKGAFPTKPVIDLRAGLAGFFDRVAAEASQGEEQAKHLDWCILNGVTGPNLPKEVALIMESLGQSRVAECLREYLNGDDCVVAVNHLLFRLRDSRTITTYKPTGQDHWFHQDHDLIPGQFPVNVWIPLSVVDSTCLGLSFAFPYTSEIFKLPFPIREHLAKEGGYLWTPDVEPGDVLLFHRNTIHGGFSDATKTTPRYSVEFRVGSSKNVPDAYKNDVLTIPQMTWFQKLCQPVTRLFRKSA